MSHSAQLGKMVYAQAAAAEPRQVLAEIEELLQALGATKSDLLTARLVDITGTGLRMRASPSRSPHVQGKPPQG
jgi:hypothetical protein